MTVRGDVETAIRMYRDVADNPGQRRDIAAVALLELGQAYEVLGRDGARDAYRRIVVEYGDQLETVKAARKRLAVLRPEAPVSPEHADVAMRRLWVAPVAIGIRALSPDAQKVAFVDWGGLEDPALRGEADVAIYDLTSERASLVTHLPPQSLVETYPSSPIWSTDGKWIAYSHWDDDWNHQRLHLVRPDGSDPRILVDNEQLGQVDPQTFSSDGTFIVARVRGWDELFRIVLVSVENGQVTVLKTEGDHPPHPLSLSPDDRFIVYDQLPDGADRHDIFALAVDGSGEFTIASGPADETVPYWTPDGDRVVFVSDRSGRRALWSVGIDDGRPVGDPTMVRDNIGALYPLGFTASGSLAYSLPLRRTDVFAARLDLDSGRMTEPRLLTDGFVGRNMLPTWSPEGRRVAFVSRRGSGGDRHHLVVRNIPTGEEWAWALPFAAADRIEIDWADDGTAVYLQSGDRGEYVSYRVDVRDGLVVETDRRQSAGFAGGSTYALTTDRQAGHLGSLAFRLVGQNDFQMFEDGRISLTADETLLLVRDGVKRLATGTVDRHTAAPLTPLAHMHAWRLSPDGKTLALAIASDPEVVVSDVLYLFSLEDAQLRELTRTPGEQLRRQLGERPELDETYVEQEILAIHWTPRGDRLLYAVGEGEDAEPEFWTIGVEGGAPKRVDLDLTLGEFAGLSFRSDGGAIAYTREERLRELWLLEGVEW
jgi:TolB protein